MGGDEQPRQPRYTKILNRTSDEHARERGTAIQIVPFVRGRRPTDEVSHHGLGSSDHAALILGRDAADNYVHLKE
jgi:hypothetical protein